MPEITLFGEVGTDITAKGVADSLKVMGRAQEITVRLASAGGSVTEGVAVLNLLCNHPAKIHVAIEGHVLSMGSVIAMAGDAVSIASNALLMAHDPWTTITGNSTELRKTAGIMDKMAEAIVDAYVRKTGKSAEVIQAMMAAETWFDADEALAYGLVDSIDAADDGELIAASFDTSKFNIPDRFKGKVTMTTKNEVEVTSSEAAKILAAEQKRRSDIRAAFYQYADEYPRLLNDCLDDPTIDVQAASAKLLDALGRGRGPLGAGNKYTVTAGNNDLQEFRNAAIDCLAMREGIKIDKPHPGARDLQRMSVVNMAEVCLKRATGRSTASMSNSQIVAAAITHSSSDFPQLLSNLAGKSLQAGYLAEPASFKQWVHEVEVNDFKTNSRPQLSETPALKKVLENGEFTYGSMTEAEENYVLETFGRIFSISRQALINDDLGAWTRNAWAFGQSATRRMGDTIYSVLTDNANMSDGNALFSSAHGNLASTGAALSVDSLGAARAAMALQKGLAGQQTLNLMAKYLIVPVSIQTQAEQLLASLVDESKSNDTVNPAWIRGLELVTDARLDADSTTAWYLACDWNQLDTVESATLAGGGVSYTEKEGFEVDGLSVKMRLDHAAKAIEWKGLYKNPGA